MEINIDPVVSQIRVFHGGDLGTFETQGKFYAIATLLHIDKDTVCIKGLLGKLDKETIVGVFRELALRGYSDLIMTRHKSDKLIDLTKYLPTNNKK
jgi:hypothetical protein